MRITYYTITGIPVVERIELPLTRLGCVELERMFGEVETIDLKLNGRLNRHYELVPDSEVHGTYMVFEDGVIRHQPMVDVMYALANISEYELNNLIDKLFNIFVPGHAYMVRDDLYRIVA